MKKLILIPILTALLSCNNNNSNTKTTPEVDTIVNKTQDADTLINETESSNYENFHNKLKDHFALYRIEPSLEIKNTEVNQADILLGKHKIKWISTEDETKIKIDNDLFTLKDKITLNQVWSKRDSVGFANNWDEIKLFKYNDKEYIGIKMSFAPCNGLGCSVSYFLIYDVATKSKNFFGTFRTDNELELFDFSNDNKIDYVSKTYNGDAHDSTPIEYIYELYSREANGQFKPQKDKSGLAYQIKITTFPNDLSKAAELTENWVTKIK